VVFLLSVSLCLPLGVARALINQKLPPSWFEGFGVL